MITEAYIDKLRAEISLILSDKRMKHTLAVEEMALRLGKLYFADEATLLLLRSAALLHDVTKERSTDEHIAICEEAGLLVLKAERKAPKMFHAKTAALIIPQKYPEFCQWRSLLFHFLLTGPAWWSLAAESKNHVCGRFW